MRGIVQSRPFKRSSHRNKAIKRALPFQSKRLRGNSYDTFFSLFLKKRGAMVFIVFLSLFLVIFLLKGTRYNPAYLIKDIEYPRETRVKYGNTELFVLASKFLRGKYYNTLRVGGESKLLDWVRKEYPFVKAVHLNFLGNQKLSVDFDYFEPDFLVKMGEKKFGIWKGGVGFDLDNAWSLGKTGFVVDTPQYLSGTTSLSGFFFEVDYAWYMENLPLIKEKFPRMTRFVYLAGSPSFVIFEDGKMIYLYKDNPLNQLQKFDWLKKNYKDYKSLKTIDLGSLTQEKVVIGK